MGILAQASVALAQLGFCVHAVVVGASYVHGEGVGSVGWDDGSLYGAMGAVMECV